MLNVRWRPAFTGFYMLGAWLFGSVLISLVITSQVHGFRYAAVVLAVWGLIFAAFTYVVLALALNRTSVRVESDKLVIRDGPLPFGRGSSTGVRDVEEVFVSSYRTSGARGLTGGTAYTVMARTKTGGTIPIVANSVLDAGVAEDLAREIQAMLARALIG